MGINLGILYLDFNSLFEAAAHSPFHAFWYLFVHGGFLAVLYALWEGGRRLWLHERQEKYGHTLKSVLLCINVPKDNEQSPKAVENIFAQLAGAHKTDNFVEKWWKGKFQESFSFEIVSTGGYVQFFVRTVVAYRDLIESAFYAQYPAAEISEVEDYANFAPNHFPNEEYNLWGTEMILVNKQYYPLRSYTEFEHQLSQEFKDPMAALLEAMSKIGTGEHIWIQILLTPTDDSWKKEGLELAKKLVGAKVEHKASFAEKAIGLPGDIVSGVVGEIFGGSEEETRKKDPPLSIMQFLTPGERRVLEALQFKLAKIGFKTKIRLIYLGKKEMFHKGRGVSPILGAIKQFNTLDLNALKPNKVATTHANYFFVKQRIAEKQRKIIRAYKDRSTEQGGPLYMLNIEELAGLYHFPVIQVKAPLVQKTLSKRMEPPIELPTKTAYFSPRTSLASHKTPAPDELPLEEDAPPPNLPIH
ncbi:MAG: hypothetical protein AAB444_02370 [Patescibacteria group bacterium]